ncbi:winged helix-turn-helix domain-containing protein [Nocardiopsis rhodophaea]|uniref:winged helix-turn-helix domain-containing protein n=1 Tax=Nocardiopsis rhodophaea TaxID=280238 RepID=UPI0031E2D304
MGEKTDRVERAIRELITSGELGPGGRLPSERTLAKELDAGRTTIRLVLTRLSAEGIIRSEHGRGYFANTDENGEVK